MVVSIGVTGCTRELRLNLDLSPAELQREIEYAIINKTLLRLTETNGNVVLVPAPSIGYVVVTEDTPRPVGFTVR